MQRGINYWFAERIGARIYYGWAVVAVALLANLSVFSFNPVFGLFITPLEAEFGWERATIARALTLGTVLGATLAPLLGLLIDRVGTRVLMVIFGLTAGVSYVLLGKVQANWQFNLLIALIYPLTWMGVGQMMSSVNISRWFVRRRGRAMGIVMMGASGGSVIFIPLCTVLIAGVGWRATFAVIGAGAALLISLPAWLLLVNRPEQLGLSGHAELRGGNAGAPGADPATGSSAAAAPHPAPVEQGVDTWTLSTAVRTRAFWFTLLGLMVGSIAVQGYFVHAVPHMESRGFSRLLASSVWSTFFLTGVGAKFLWGFVIERIGVRPALVLLFLGEATGLALLLTAQSSTGLFVYAVVNGLGHGPYLQLQAMVWADYFGRRSIGRIYGFVQPAILVSGSAGPWLGGYLFDVAGDYTRFLQAGIVLCLAASAVFLFTPPPAQRAPQPSPAVP